MNQAAAQKELLQKIAMYCNSIIEADNLGIAEQVWSATPDSSFIHPRGHEIGWSEIRNNFYGKTMNDMFSKRDLKMVGVPAIKLYGDSAVVEFDWDFVAVMRDDGSSLHTTGRESQVYIKFPDLGWRIVHVHYSGAPVDGRGVGF